MAQFLIRSFDGPSPYATAEFPTGSLPRSRDESYVPWALTVGGKVIYAVHGQHRSWPGSAAHQGIGTSSANAAYIKPYDSLVSQNRRRLAESALGLLALQHPAFTKGGVDAVNKGIQQYLDMMYVSRRQELTDAMFAQIGHYFYTNGGTGFGRISTSHKNAVGADGVRKGIFAALARGRLDQKLAIHDAVGRKLLPALGGPQLATYDHWMSIVRQDWFDNAQMRGRANAPTRAQPTKVGGITNTRLGNVAIARTRGVDSYQRDLHRTRQPQADDYYDDLDARNLLFGAGISGTTGTLLAAAFAFAGVMRGEPLKEYVLAIIGYLVGGGMHSYHESMAVAQKAGLPYTPGAFIPSLPQAFLNSMQFRNWRAEYYDVVELGATHWRHNAGALPSHLNTQLRH
ncbi:hypothetical protein [Piscinibacter sakaiensis]|uniref:hypothetical protein n=1 Tax=Piscinibacter sakaiensis TaxID=1547922 RepID=UPI003AAD4529